MPLPKRQTDQYQDIDHTRYDTIDEMTRSELLEMSELALARGDMDARAVWQEAALSNARAEETKVAAERFARIVEPKPMPPHGVPILEPMTESWQGDTEYRRLQDEWRMAQAKADGTQDGSPDKFDLETAAATARAAANEREQTIKADMTLDGLWSESKQRSVDAQAGLAEKAAQIAQQAAGR
jgi:hypothetical protein